MRNVKVYEERKTKRTLPAWVFRYHSKSHFLKRSHTGPEIKSFQASHSKHQLIGLQKFSGITVRVLIERSAKPAIAPIPARVFRYHSKSHFLKRITSPVIISFQASHSEQQLIHLQKFSGITVRVFIEGSAKLVIASIPARGFKYHSKNHFLKGSRAL